MNKEEKNKSIKKHNIKIIAIVSVILIAASSLLLFGNQLINITKEKVDYNTFIQQVEKGDVKFADINQETGKVTYKLKDQAKECYTNYPYTEDFSEMLLINNVDVKIHEANWMELFLKYGTSLILIVLMVAFMKISTNLGVSDFDIEPVDKIKTRLSDVAGLEEIKEDLLMLSDMMKNTDYKTSGARIPRGVLLQGPPGNGKTLLARAFAGETGVNFIAVNACDFGSQFVGVGSNKIKKVFETARANAPCVIFIDEIDSVGAKRSAHQDAAGKEMNTMLTALLNQMDGFNQSDNIMVLAATNRVDDLDDALIRPGRFDRQFVINNPDKTARIKLFELYTKGKKLDENVDFDRLSIITYGYSASKIECIVNEAIILSVKNNRKSVAMADFEEAVLQMDIKGHLKKEYTQTELERKVTAYHEAGHAVIAYYETDKEVSSITIRPTTSGAGGFTITEEREDNNLCPINDYRNEIKMLYAGRAAEVTLLGSIDNATTGASQDIQEATNLAKALVSICSGIDYSQFGSTGNKTIMEKTQKLLNELWNASLESVRNHWVDIEIIAKELIANETISKEQFIEIIEK